MNILILYQSPWWNAAAYYTFNVVKVLKQSGHNLIYGGKDNTPLVKEISQFGIKINNMDLFTYSPIRLIANLNRTKKLITENSIDIVIPISAPGHILTGLIKMFNIKSLSILKICLDNVHPVSNVLNRYLHNKLTNYFLFPGLATKKRYDKIFSIDNYKILHAPLDLKEFFNFSFKNGVKENLGIPDDKVIVSFIGRFSPEKGVFFLVDVMKKAVETAYNFYGISPERVSDRIGLMTGLLVFYVVYTLWWGFAIFFIFEGIGLTMKKAKVKKEV